MGERASADTWVRVAFGDVVALSRERSRDPVREGFQRSVGLEHMEPGELRLRHWGNVSDVATFSTVFRAGQVLFGKRRAYQRKVAVADFDGVCSGDIYVLSAKRDYLLPELLPFICQTEGFFAHAIGTSAGSLSPRTNWSSLASYEFGLPTMAEQRRIAGLFQLADCASQKFRDLLKAEQVAELRVFSDLLSRCGAEQRELGSLLTQSPRNGCSAVESSSPTGHWVLSLSALTRSGYRRGELKSVDRTDAMAAAVLRAGDLLISRSNTRELVGFTGIFDEERSDVSWPDTMMRLTVDESCVRKRFLELFLRTPAGREQIQRFAAGTSASMKKINAENVKKLLIPVPTVDDQDAVVCNAESLGTARRSTESRLRELAELRCVMLASTLSPTVRGA